MLEPGTKSLHYKMYKSGKSWVFAGLISAGLLFSFGGENALADITPASDAPQSEQVSQESETSSQEPVAPENAAPEAVTPAGTTDSSDDASGNGTNPTGVPAPQTTTPTNTDPKIVTQQSNDASNSLDVHKNNQESSIKDSDLLREAPATSVISKKKSLLRTPALTTAPANTAVSTAAPLVAADESIDTWMPNKALQTLVADQLKKSVSTLTTTDLLKLTTLEIGYGQTSTFIDGTSSYSLKGLEFATNLTYLDLGYNLMNRQLNKYLHGDITDISPLSNLTKLTSLDLSSNRIADVSSLAGLTNLKTLAISGNSIADFSLLDYKQYSDMEFGTQDIVLTTPVTVDSADPTITIPQIFKLPQNYNANLQYDVSSDYTKTIKDLYIWQDNMVGNGAMHRFIRGGEIKADAQGNHIANADGSVTFLNIPDQISPANLRSDRPEIAIVQNPVTYYLMEDIVAGFEVQVNIFIPYVNPQPAGTLTLNYLDENGKAIQPSKVLTGHMVGDDYTIADSDTAIAGYHLTSTDGAMAGKYTADDLAITFHYKKDTTPVTPVTPPVVTPTTQVTVTAHYVDQNGNTIHADQVLTGNAGDSYATTAFAVPNYRLTATPANAQGTFGTSAATVTYVYEKVADTGAPVIIDPATPKPAIETGELPAKASGKRTPAQQPVTALKTTGAAVKITAATTATPQGKSVKSTPTTTLPQTSERTVSPVIGLALLLGTLIGFGFKRKQH